MIQNSVEQTGILAKNITYIVQGHLLGAVITCSSWMWVFGRATTSLLLCEMFSLSISPPISLTAFSSNILQLCLFCVWKRDKHRLNYYEMASQQSPLATRALCIAVWLLWTHIWFTSTTRTVYFVKLVKKINSVENHVSMIPINISLENICIFENWFYHTELNLSN